MNEEIKPSVFSGLSTTKQYSLMLFFAVCVLFGVYFVKWLGEPNFRPIINDISVIDSSKAVDILEQHEIKYKVDVAQRILYIDVARSVEAKLALAKAGFDMEYPKYVKIEKAQSECEAEQRVVIIASMLKPIIGALIIIVLLVGLVRPILKVLVDVKS